MHLEPFGWNVVVVGAWNRAIFTPAWIGKNIFNLPEGTPFPIEIPIHARAPWRIRHEQVAVLVGDNSLEITVDACDFTTLDKARQFAKRALAELPRTPLSATGYNVRYGSAEATPEFAGLFGESLDRCIGTAGLTVSDRLARRTVPFENGVINLEAVLKSSNHAVFQANFHMDSEDAEELTGWLDIPISRIEETVNSLLAALPGD